MYVVCVLCASCESTSASLVAGPGSMELQQPDLSLAVKTCHDKLSSNTSLPAGAVVSRMLMPTQECFVSNLKRIQGRKCP